MKRRNFLKSILGLIGVSVAPTLLSKVNDKIGRFSGSPMTGDNFFAVMREDKAKDFMEANRTRSLADYGRSITIPKSSIHDDFMIYAGEIGRVEGKLSEYKLWRNSYRRIK